MELVDLDLKGGKVHVREVIDMKVQQDWIEFSSHMKWMTALDTSKFIIQRIASDHTSIML